MSFNPDLNLTALGLQARSRMHSFVLWRCFA